MESKEVQEGAWYLLRSPEAFSGYDHPYEGRTVRVIQKSVSWNKSIARVRALGEPTEFCHHKRLQPLPCPKMGQYVQLVTNAFGMVKGTIGKVTYVKSRHYNVRWNRCDDRAPDHYHHKDDWGQVLVPIKPPKMPPELPGEEKKMSAYKAVYDVNTAARSRGKILVLVTEKKDLSCGSFCGEQERVRCVYQGGNAEVAMNRAACYKRAIIVTVPEIKKVDKPQYKLEV